MVESNISHLNMSVNKIYLTVCSLFAAVAVNSRVVFTNDLQEFNYPAKCSNMAGGSL